MAIFFALCFSIKIPEVYPQQQKDVKKTLEAKVKFNISWNVDTESENNTGSLNLNAKGILFYDEGTSSLPHGMMTIMLPYRIQNMQATYMYKERVTDKDPPPNCPSLLSEYDDAGTMQIQPVPGGAGDLMIHELGSIARLTKMNKVAPPEVQDLLNDYYDFFLVGEDQEIKGRRQDPQDCRSMEQCTQNLQLCSMEIRFLTNKDGTYSGSANWTSYVESGTPFLNVKVSNLPDKMDDEHFSPKNEPGNVQYSLSWEIKEAVALTVQRKVKGEWKDIESDEELKNVTVGERVELKGVVFPEQKKITSSKWVIDGNNNRNYLKKYDANDKKAEVIPMADEDLDKDEVVFYWYKGEQGSVKLEATVDGDIYNKEVQFNIKRPDYTVEWENSASSSIKEFIEGGDIEDRWPRENWPPNPPQYQQFQGQTLKGLQYDGILFKCSLESETPGETQWVQLVQDEQKIDTFTERGASTPSGKELDKVYPCARNDSFFDAPGIPFNNANEKGYQSWRVIDDFELYIMYRPKGNNKSETEKNEWVPIKLIKWSWGGEIRRNSSESDWYINDSSDSPRLDGGTLEPHGENEPKVQDTEEYPTWSPKKR
jgi:hypothetical protein